MKKILIVSTVSRQFYLFERGNIKVLNSLGYEVHGAANYEDANERLDDLNIVRHHFDIQRSPYSFKNINAYKQLKKIMRTGHFDVVHCHSPMGGVIGRLAAKAVGIKKIIYTAHGFHFYKGAPLINWFLYYPIEKILADYTDILITINKEDYERAISFKNPKTEYIPGIGVDLSDAKVRENNKRKILKQLNLSIPEDTFIMISVGELNKNKNHEVAIRALSKLNRKDIHYLICGIGELKEMLQTLIVDLKLEKQVHLMGYRDDVIDILSISDVFVFPSYREGLSVSVIEAMAIGLPIIASKIRGNIDLVSESGGYLFSPEDSVTLAKYIQEVYDHPIEKKYQIEVHNKQEARKYNMVNVTKIMKKVYRTL